MLDNQLLTKDILTVERGIIGHQVNCKGVFGAGLAKQIATKYPEAREHYLRYVKERIAKKEPLLGQCLLTPLNPANTLYIAHLFGQDGYGRDRQYTNYMAVTAALHTLNKLATDKDLPVYLPYQMGCGIGGGDWDIVSELIEKRVPGATICELPSTDRQKL